jgi:hypothetical protein
MDYLVFVLSQASCGVELESLGRGRANCGFLIEDRGSLEAANPDIS